MNLYTLKNPEGQPARLAPSKFMTKEQANHENMHLDECGSDFRWVRSTPQPTLRERMRQLFRRNTRS